MTNNQQVASTILNQMGGMNRIGVMVGARDFVAVEDGVQFSFKGNRKMNKMVVKLDRGLDLYEVEFWNIRTGRTFKMDKVEEFSGVYAEDLKPIFENATGLYLSL